MGLRGCGGTSLRELSSPAPQASLSKETRAHRRENSQPKIAGLLSSAYNRRAPSPAFQCPRQLHAVTSLSGPRIGCVNSWGDGSPPGPGNGQHLLLCLCCAPCCRFSPVQRFATSRTVACQTPLSMGSSRQEYCSGLPYLPPGDLPDLGIKPMSLVSPALAGGFFTISATWETLRSTIVDFKLIRVLILHPSSSPLFCGNSVSSHPQASNSSLELQKKSGSLRPPVHCTVNEPHLL